MDELTSHEMTPEVTSEVVSLLQNSYPILSPENRNAVIVEVGRLRGSLTRSLRAAWPEATIFTIDDGWLASHDPEMYVASINELRLMPKVTIIQGTSPFPFAWPKEWYYDLLVYDIGSNYEFIRANHHYWQNYAKVYPTYGSGVILAALPRASELKRHHRDLFLEEIDMTVEHNVQYWMVMRRERGETSGT